MTAENDVPSLSLEDAATLAESLYGMRATAHPLPSYRDANFVLRVDGAAAAVLKVVHPQTPFRRVETWINAHEAAEAAETLPVPRVLPCESGGRYAMLRLHDGRDAVVYAVTWLQGRSLAEVAAAERPRRLWDRLGSILASLGSALADVKVASQGQDERWDLSRAAWILKHLDVHEDPRRRATVEAAMVQFLGVVEPALERLPIAVIHGDANDHNLLVNGAGDALALSGILDFGDLGRGPRVFELAIAGAYAIFDQEDPLSVLETLVRGWCEVAPLEREEIEVLLPALAARLAVSVTSSALTARARPDDAYVTVSEDAAWRALDRLAELDANTVRPRLLRAAGLSVTAADTAPSREELLRRRARLLPGNQSLSYSEPLLIMKGRGPWLYDETGRAHLDCVNNVAHVGHAHPRVAAALAKQAQILNTNTRYLHPEVLDYAERLLATFPEELEVVTFVNSGSEANELALRMARAATGRRHAVVLDWAYHGHTGALIDLSPYKHARAGGEGPPDWVHVAPLPDLYRGVFRRGRDADPTARYLEGLEEALDGAGENLAAFFAESIPSCGGQIVLPEGYLAAAYERVRARGGLCVADEVQVGFGRVGRSWWAFQEQGVVPDIVSLGKPIGDGHPMAAVVCTRAVAEAFANGMEYFATFGGNPVSAATGHAVLQVVEEEGLRERAVRVGDQLLAGFRALAQRHPRLGDVRGRGMFIGLEFVSDPRTREPDPKYARHLVEDLRGVGILLSTDGPDENVIKIKPPLVFGESEADLLLSSMARALAAR